MDIYYLIYLSYDFIPLPYYNSVFGKMIHPYALNFIIYFDEHYFLHYYFRYFHCISQ
jgi:hypothetical protein